MLPRFEVVGRLRPVDLVAPSQAVWDVEPGDRLLPLRARAPYVAVVAEPAPGRAPEGGPATLAQVSLVSGGVHLTAQLDGAVSLEVAARGRPSRHRSRRHGRPRGPVSALALTLTGTHLTALTREAGGWHARARVDLARLDVGVDPRDEQWLAGLAGRAPGASRLLAGGFGQLGLRDLRVVSHRDGSPVVPSDGTFLLTASSAGPGFFDTAHTSVWALDPGAPALRHLADLFFRRPDRPGVYGDHATHLVRDTDRWLVATSTWGDFDRRRDDASVAVTLAETRADLTSGRHVLDTCWLDLPTDGIESVGVWDPHLVHTGREWLVGYVSATRFFSFHPVLAAGPALDALRLRAAATTRRATEGTTLLRVDDRWHVLASDGREGRPGAATGYPVLDLELRDVGAVDAPYPSNIPWPTLLRDQEGWLLVTFDGTRAGGRLLGYGTHGDVVLMREAGAAGRPRSGQASAPSSGEEPW